MVGQASIEKNDIEQALRSAQFKLDRMLHDLRGEFIARESKLRDEYLTEVAEITASAEVVQLGPPYPASKTRRNRAMKVELDDTTRRHLKHLVCAVMEQEDSYIRNEMGTDEEHDGGVILDDETLAARAEAHPGGSDILWLHAYRVFCWVMTFPKE
jgi:hypothetical protein